MTPMATLAKTTILLAAASHNGWNPEQVETLIPLNLCGEIRSVSRLDNRRSAVLRPGEKLLALDGSATLSNDPAPGPVLQKRAGAVLWAPFGDTAPGQPGKLMLQANGSLVLRSVSNAVVWSAANDGARETPSVLALSGSHAAGTLNLAIHDYADDISRADLYQQA